MKKATCIVEGVNIVTKHTKPSAQNTKGGIVKKEAPIAYHNVMLWDAKTSGTCKVKRTEKMVKLVRVSKKSGGGNKIMSTTNIYSKISR